MAIDVALKVRGCVVISACSLCGVTTEDSDKLFLLCPFARVLWEWLQEIAHLNLDCSSLVSLLNSVGTRNRRQQVKEVLISTIVHILWVIWFCRNSLRFRDTKISLSQGQIMVVFSVSLSGFLASRSTSNSITEFTILKTFKVDARPPTSVMIKQINWHFPICGHMKCNTDGATLLVVAYFVINLVHLGSILLIILEWNQLYMHNCLQLFWLLSMLFSWVCQNCGWSVIQLWSWRLLKILILLPGRLGAIGKDVSLSLLGCFFRYLIFLEKARTRLLILV